MPTPSNSNFDTANARGYKTPMYLVHFEDEAVDYCNHQPSSPNNTLKQYLVDIKGLTQKIIPEQGSGSISGLTLRILDYDDEITALLATDTYFFHRRKTIIKAGYLGMAEADMLTVMTGWVTGLDMDKDLLVYQFKVTDPQKWMQRKIFRGAEDTDVLVSGNPINLLMQVLTSTGNTAQLEDFNAGVAPSAFTYTDITDTYPSTSTLRASITADPGYIIFNHTDVLGLNYRYVSFKARWYSGSASAAIKVTYVIDGGHSYDATNYYKAVTLDITGDWATYTLDMWDLDAGGSDWKDETVTSIRIDLAGNNGVAYEFDYLCVGNGRYDTLDAANGLGIDVEHLDIHSLEDIRDNWYPGDTYYMQFTITERIKAKDWIETEILKPLNCYPVIDGQGRFSVKPFKPPLAALETTETITEDNIIGLPGWSANLEALVNEVETHYDWDSTNDEFDSIDFFVDGTSLNNRGPGKKPISIKTKGLHTDPWGSMNGRASDITAVRKTKIFGRFATPPVAVSLKTFFSRMLLEAGDIIELTNSHIPDIEGGSRGLTSRRVEIINRAIDWKKGTVNFNLLDTGFDKDTYGVVSPIMTVVSGSSGTVFTVPGPDAARFTVGWKLNVHDAGMRLKKANTAITVISGTTITVDPTIGSTPAAGWICTFAAGDNCTTAQQLYAFAEAANAHAIVP